MTGSNTRRLYLLNLSTSYAQIFGRMAVMFFLTPFLLSQLGKAQYGLWVLLSSVIAYFEFSDFGFTTAIGRELPARRARRDWEGISRIVSTTFWSFMLLLAALTPVAFGLTMVLSRLFHVDPAQAAAAQRTFLIIFGVFVIGFEKRVFDTIINSSEKLYAAHLLNVAYNLAYGLTFYLVAAGGGQVESLAVGLLILTAVFVTLTYLVARRVMTFSISWRLFDPRLIRELWRPSLYYFLAGIGTIVILNSDNLVLSAYLGTAAVAVYAVAYRFVDLCRLLIGRLTDVLFPRIAYVHAVGDWQALRRMALRFVLLSGGFAVVAGAGLYLVGYDLLRWWVGADNLVARSIFHLFILYFLLHSTTHASGQFIGAMGIHKPIALVGLAEAAINLSLSLWLVTRIGAVGVALGTVVAHLLATGWFAHFHLWRYLSRQEQTAAAPSSLAVMEYAQ